jgi:hypothetical protein
MLGLVNFASQIGLMLSMLLPPLCYLGAIVLFIIAAWGLWRQAQPDNPYRGRPWVPLVSLLLSGVLASFDRVLSMANVTGGSTIAVSVAGMTSYVPPPAESGTLLGASPATTIVNVVTLFELFFQAFGAMACLFAVLSWRATVVGRSNRSQGGALVQFIFGILLINVLTISRWVVGLFA